MISVQRSAFLGVLTLCIYAIGLWIQPEGHLIFPFPLYPAFFFVLSVIYFFSEKEDKTRLLILFSGVLSLLSAAFLWEIVLSLQDFMSFMNKLYVDIFFLASRLTICFWIVWKVLRSDHSLVKFILASLIVLIFMIGLFYNNKLISSFALLLPCVFATAIRLSVGQISLILFMLFLELSEWLSYALNNF